VEKMKKSFKLILIVCLILSTVIAPSFALHTDVATESKDMHAMFDYINIMGLYFDISTWGKAECDVIVTALDAEAIGIEVELQQYDSKNYRWKTIKSWSNYEEGITSGAGGTYWVLKGYLYRCIGRCDIYVGGKIVEEHEMISKCKYYD